MSKYADLITITKIVDTETGNETPGDLDYRIHCQSLEQWLAGGAGRIEPESVMVRRKRLADEMRSLADALDDGRDLGPFSVTIKDADKLHAERVESTKKWLAEQRRP